MLVNLAACPISIENCNTSSASLLRVLPLTPPLLSRIISLWLIVGILSSFGGFSVLYWCWVTVISINVFLCCYQAVAPFFLSGFSVGSFFLSGFSFSLIGCIFLSGFPLSFLGCTLSRFSLSFTDRIFLSGFYSPSIGCIFLSRTISQAVFLHRRVGFFCRCFLPSSWCIYQELISERYLFTATLIDLFIR